MWAARGRGRSAWLARKSGLAGEACLCPVSTCYSEAHLGMAHAYDQHCGLAHALDLVGERWTLLIVRELLAGPRRYTDLAAGLVSVPSNVLATRLREMESRGLVCRRTLPAPAASVVVYELT